MRSRDAAAGEDSFVSAGAFVAPTLIQSACVEWCSGLAAHLRRGPFFREKKRLCTVPSGVARQGIQVRCSGGGRDCEGKLGNHDVQNNVTSKVNPPRWNFRCFGNTLFPRDFTRKLIFGEAKKAKQGTGVDRKGLMNNNLKPFDQNWDEAVVHGIFMQHT